MKQEGAKEELNRLCFFQFFFLLSWGSIQYGFLRQATHFTNTTAAEHFYYSSSRTLLQTVSSVHTTVLYSIHYGSSEY